MVQYNRFESLAQFPIVTIIGQSKLKEAKIQASQILERLGITVLGARLFELNATEDLRFLLNIKYRKYIFCSDLVVAIVNKDRYIGESTKGEIDYAVLNGIPCTTLTIRELETIVDNAEKKVAQDEETMLSVPMPDIHPLTVDKRCKAIFDNIMANCTLVSSKRQKG